MLRRASAEFVGTAWMVGVGCGSVAWGASPLVISASFGVAVTVAILLFQPISGAHINPAVTLAFFRSGHLEKEAVVPYITAQCLGALFAGFLLDGAGATTVAPDVSLASAALIEVFITFALMASIYWIVVRSQTHISVAFVVGITVAILAYLFGSFTGASMNPARTLGPNIIAGESSIVPFYILMTVIGAWVAAEIFNRTKFALRPSQPQD